MSLWAAVDRLVDGAVDPGGLRVHGLQLLAARRWRATGRPVPAELLAAERAAALAVLAAPAVLARVRAAVPGPLVLLKGPELAARYPDQGLRPLGDLDLLVLDPAAAHRALRAGGFEVDPGNAAARPHHLPPLRWPGSPLPVELHNAVRAPAWARLPPPAALLAAAVPGAFDVAGVLTLPPREHALVVAAHAWAHGPLGRLLDLVDVAVLVEGADRPALAALARAWGLGRLWAATLAAVDALSRDEPLPWWAARLGARHLPALRERTVLEVHLARWAGGMAAPTRAAAVRAVGAAVAGDLRPRPREGWGRKVARAGRALGGAGRPLSEHAGRDYAD